MSVLADDFVIVGKPIPYNEDREDVTLLRIAVGSNDVEIVLLPTDANQKRISFGIWEHTIHELEYLSSAIHKAAEGVFPGSYVLPRPESWIGTKVNLSLVAECEVGYSLSDPGADRCSFFSPHVTGDCMTISLALQLPQPCQACLGKLSSSQLMR